MNTIQNSTQAFERFIENGINKNMKDVYCYLCEELSKPKQFFEYRCDYDVVSIDFWNMLIRYLENNNYIVDFYVSYDNQAVLKITY